METVQVDITIDSLDIIVIQKLQESAKTLAECIKQDIIRASMATKPFTAYADIDDQIRMIRKINSVLEYFGGDPVDWTGYK